MKKNGSSFVPDFLSSRRNLIEILLSGILLGAGIDIIASNIPALLGWTESAAIALGAVFALLPIVYFTLRSIGQRERKRNLTGFLIHRKGSIRVIDTPRYHYSSRLQKYLSDGIAEYSSLAKLWKHCPEDESESIEPQLNKIITEATVFYVLCELAEHLKAFFVGDDFEGDNQTDLTNLRGVNRFLRLYSPGIPSSHIHGVDSDFYVLRLPDESKIRPIASGSGFEIETRRMRFTVLVTLGRHKTDLPRGFKRIYLGVNENSESNTDVFAVTLEITVSFKPRAFFSGTGWNYYRWLDSFLAELDEKFSGVALFERVGWESAMVIIEGTAEYAEQEKIRLQLLKDNRRTYLETPTLTEWLLAYHEYHERKPNDVENILRSYEFGENEIQVPFIAKYAWDAHADRGELIKILCEKDTILTHNEELSSKYEIDYDLINEQISTGRRIWDAPTLYLHNVIGSAKNHSIQFEIGTCRYYQAVTSMIKLENETIEAVRIYSSTKESEEGTDSASFENCPIRERHFLRIDDIEHNLYKPMTLGCMIVFALKSEKGYDIIIQTRSNQTATANRVTSIAPTFGLSPFLGKPPDNRGLLFYNFLKEYLEEFFNQTELIQPFDSSTTYNKYYESIYFNEMVKPLLTRYFSLYYLGFGFNLINGFPDIGLLAKLDHKFASKRIKDKMRANWEVASYADLYQGDLPIEFVNNKEPDQLEGAFSRLDPASAFFLSRALRHLN